MTITDPILLAILKADILADPAFAGQFAEQIAAAYNLPASPEFIVWKSSVDVDEIMRNGMDWTQVDNLTVGKARYRLHPLQAGCDSRRKAPKHRDGHDCGTGDDAL